ncbi:MAG: type IV pilus modification PilV family protein [bacterium]
MESHKNPRSEEGFTLIEIVVSMTVLAIGILGLALVFPLSVHDLGKSGSLTKAIELCTEKIEDLHAVAYDSPELEPGVTHADTLNPIDGIYGRTWEVEADVPMSGCKHLSVSVTWGEPSRSVTISTVLASAGR